MNTSFRRPNGRKRVTALISVALLSLLFMTSNISTAAGASRPTPEYIVVLQPKVDARSFANGLKNDPSISVGHTYRTVLNGFSAKLDDKAREALRKNRNV